MGKNAQSQKTGSGNVLKTPINREFSSGGVIFKKQKDITLWLVRKTAGSELYPKQFWMLPKGWIDDESEGVPGPMASGKVKADEKSMQKNAIREVREEGGVEAKIIKKIETIKYFFKTPDKGNVLKFVTFYLMEYLADVPEGFGWETAEVKWLPYEEAKKQLSFGAEKQILVKAKGLQFNLDSL